MTGLTNKNFSNGGNKREKVITFATTHDMLRAETVLSKFIACESVPAPPQSESKCTTAIAIEEQDLNKAKRIMEKENIKWNDTFAYNFSTSKLIGNLLLDDQLAEADSNEKNKNENILAELFEKRGRLTQEDLQTIFTLEKEQLKLMEQLYNGIVNPGKSLVVPVGSCQEKCRGCILSRRENLEATQSGWVFRKFRQDFKFPLVLVYGDKVEEDILEKITTGLNELQSNLPLVYFGKDLLSLPVEILSEGSAFSCRDNVLNKTTEEVIKDIMFLKENTNPDLASQSLIPVHINLLELSQKDKLKIIRSLVGLRLTLGDRVVIGAPELNEDNVRTLGESVKFRWC